MTPKRRLWGAMVAGGLLIGACGSSGKVLQTAAKSTTTTRAATTSTKSTASGATGTTATSGVTGATGTGTGATAAPTTVRPASVTGPDGYGITECPAAAGVAAAIRSFAAPFKRCIDTTKTYVATITTNKGVLTVNLDPKAAPLTVNNFVALARNKYFDGLSCHRIIPGFVAQCGDPLGTGVGGPGYKFIDELPKAGAYKIGSLAMANSGPNTNGSQFFVITGASGVALPPSYSLFGLAVNSDATIKALDAAGSAANNGVPPKEKVTITSVVIKEA